MKNLIKNIASPTPKGWSKLRNIAVGVVSASLVVLSLPTMGLTVAPLILTGASYIVAIGTALGLTAQAQKKEIVEPKKEGE
jgi:hypothetical protein